MLGYIPKQPPSLQGKQLPELKDLGIKIKPDDIEGKMILVCFFDMNQRPFRYMLTELAKREGQLREKNVIILAVQFLSPVIKIAYCQYRLVRWE